MELLFKNISIRVLLLLTCYSSFTFSQNKIELESNIEGQVVNGYTGTLVVKTRNTLLGIDPLSKKVSWKNEDLKDIDLSEYEEIPYTPLCIFTENPFIKSKALSNTLNSKGALKTVVNIITGKVLFSSKKEGYKAVNNTLILPQKKCVLVDGIKNKDLVISLYSYETGEMLWELKAANTKLFKKLKRVFFDNEIILLDAQKNIYWLKNKQLIKIDSESGELLLERENITSIALNKSKNIIFLFSNRIGVKRLTEENSITALNTMTLEALWNTPILILGNISDTAQMADEMVVITSKGFNLIDIKSGTKKWDKSEALPLIKRIVPVEQGYLVVQNNYLVRIDEMGKKAWKKKIRITNSVLENPIYLLESEADVLYITPSKANKLLNEDGAKIWEEDIVLNTHGFISRNLKLSEHHFRVWDDTINNVFPVYSDQKFYVFEKYSSKKPIQFDSLSFKRKIPNLKIRENGYLLYDSNKFYFLSPSGDLLYKREYPFLDNSNVFSGSLYWTKRAFSSYTSAIGFVGNQLSSTFNSVLVSQDMGIITNVSSRIYGIYLSYQNGLNALVKLNDANMDLNMLSILRRIKKGRKHNSVLLLVVPRDNETEIMRLDIDSGKSDIIEVLDYRYTGYVVDQIEQQIYFFGKKNILIKTFHE
ncbi:PQQ-binding-like beta-propeller repeat protein [Seonamhaeicola marinus]|uniref:PQQ-binding-like beta-propeller repeat protein n=1 Tax=Seonamhaeicola marinus TaxID=1912246 RepID=A0A5D0I4W8_9FLAO|nr:PQQ-binding-like beta-propeller repeat protein [Seonamhaeicola marinus]TYA78724.1 PQQ-binding-like beta-propeller repeat protein [Seonamhaeicola marinus]